MAYADQNHAPNRTATITTVALIHVGLIYALVNGFGVSQIIDTTDDLKARFIPDPTPTVDLPPLPPEPSPQPDARVDPPVSPKQMIDLERPARFETIDTPTVDTGIVIRLPIDPVRTPAPSPQPTFEPTPSFTPKSAAPRGNPGGWVTTNDYPSRELRRGDEGTTGFRLTVGRDGRVTDCTITTSSGSDGLDAATCKLMSKRARFDPATGGDGKPVAGTYQNRVKWEIPE